MIRIKISKRLALVGFKKVIKIPLSKRGYLQGKNEAKLYKKYRGLHLLGRIYWEFFGIVCMEKYEVAKEITEYEVASLKYYIAPLSIDNCDLHNPKNWGYDKYDNLLLIDYGINEEISKLYRHVL